MTRNVEILLSIAIPTKNRQKYLKILADEVLLSSRQDFEIVIQDNSDDDSLRAWIDDRNDPRLRYNYHAGWISVVDNCDQAVLACSGKFICMLGDDDGIMLDESLDELAAAHNEGVDAVMGPVVNYIWPDLAHPLIDKYGGKLYLRPVKGTTTSEDLCKLGRRVVAHGGAMGLEDLPCVYHGFIRRSALNKLYEISGSFFPGPSPDMANAIGLTSVLKKLRRAKRVLIITGHSISSGAGAGTKGKHHGPVADQSHLPSDTVETWYPDVPFFWSGPTIYAQSLRRALDRTENTTLGKPDLAWVYAACRLFHVEYRDARKVAMQHYQGSNLLLPAKIARCYSFISLRRARNLVAKLDVRLLRTQGNTLEARSIAQAIRAFRLQQ
jgi:glycosyltransferase involved in cell wall biosynthesis